MVYIELWSRGFAKWIERNGLDPIVRRDVNHCRAGAT
jgi:hypothetical protein